MIAARNPRGGRSRWTEPSWASRIAGKAFDAVVDRRRVIAERTRTFIRDQEGTAPELIANLPYPSGRSFQDPDNVSNRHWLLRRDRGYAMPDRK